jgi:ABC-type Fe3+ transport system permease subunit
VFSTVLTLYVVPTVYVIFDAALARVGGRTRRQAALAAAEAE